MNWLKRIIAVAGIVIALELVAWVGIVLLGKDAFRTLLDFYDPRPYVGKVTSATQADGSVQRCSTFDGELFCIDDNTQKTMSAFSRRGVNKATDRDSQATEEGLHESMRVEKCASLNGELFCITERQPIELDMGATGKPPPEDTPQLSDNTNNTEYRRDQNRLVERCANFDGESICIKEKI